MSLHWKHPVKEVLRFPLLLHVRLGPLLYQTLQVVSVLLHPPNQIVHDVVTTTPSVKAKKVLALAMLELDLR